MKRKYIANYISFIRIILSIVLLFLDFYSLSFLLIYLSCGFSDILDGYIARKMKIESNFGAKLDSVADITMFGVLMFFLIPRIIIFKLIILWVLAIALIRFISVIINYFKYNSFAMIHTYGNKITGFVLFSTPIIIHFISLFLICVVVCVVASLSAIEELIINIFSKELDLNKKSIINYHHSIKSKKQKGLKNKI